ncbi:MAG TPA: transporter [Gemmatimonadota bacterium]|nr:transporter [Gemmatimonadota bacterium]
MRSVILATSRSFPLTPSDAALGDELERRGVRVASAPWETISPAPSNGDVVVLRSTWDYHRRPAEFRRWVEAWDREPATLWNPPASVLWNMDKIYLRELADLGVRIPATHWFEPGQPPDVQGFFAETGASVAVVKPRISATAWGTRIVRVGEELSETDLAPLLASGSLIQAFVPEIHTAGELSLVFFARRFSHAFLKRAVPGEFRVQVEFGGSETPATAADAAHAFAESVLRAAAHPWLYARVDVVETSLGPVLMELELIEPALALDITPGAAARFAEAILSSATAEGPCRFPT